MKRILTISLITVLALAGCSRSAKVTLNAPGLNGIGPITFGMSTAEASSVIASNAGQYAKDTVFIEKALNLYVNGSYRDCHEEYVERDAVYTVSPDKELDIRLGFFRDTLVVMRVYGRYRSESAGEFRKMLRTQYGEPVATGKEKRKGHIEMWRSEDAVAVYFLQDDGNIDPRQRRILEFVELFPTKRNVRDELAAYSKTIIPSETEQ